MAPLKSIEAQFSKGRFDLRGEHPTNDPPIDLHDSILTRSAPFSPDCD
jgi:hypothetical protein